MSRIVTTFTCLLLLTSTILVSASDNPFARWEQVRTETENNLEQSRQAVSVVQQPSSKSSDLKQEFFSGRQQPMKKSAAGETVAIKKERMKTASVADKQVAGKAIVGQSSVVQATASAQNENSQVQQVGAEFFELLDEPSSDPSTANSQPEMTFADEENPFAEFLAQEQSLSGDAKLKAQAALVNQLPDSDSPPVFDTEDSRFGVVAPSTNQVSADEFDLGDFGGPTIERSDVNPFQTASASSKPDVQASSLSTYRPEPTSGALQSKVTLEWVRLEEFNVGQSSECELLVRNDGRQAVRSVEVEIVLPEGLQVTQAVPAPTSTAASATWAYPELAAGAQKTIKLKVTPQQPGDIRMDAFVRTTAATASLVSVKQPMLSITVGGPDTVELGQQVSYTVTVKNPGTGRVNNVLIQAAIPEGLQHRQGGLLNIDVGTLNPGEQRQARLSLTGMKGGSRELSVRAVADNGLQEKATATVLVAEPKLRIGVRGPLVQMAGSTGDYELVVVNEGQAESNNVRARYQLPEGYEFVSASSGGHFNPDDSTIEWFLGTLSSNDAKRFQVALKATKTGDAAHKVGVISEQGKVSTAGHQTKVKGNAKLELKLAGSKQSANVGEELVYELKIDNVGQAPAANVGLSFEVPPGVDLVEVTGPSEYIADNGVVIFKSLPEIQDGASVTFTIRTRCTRTGEHKVRARVASQSIRRAIIAENSTTTR
ncbi:MAG: hypothetical protein ABJZ55_09960 [Fuerstiella sp.]